MKGLNSARHLVCLCAFAVVIVGCAANVGTPKEIYNLTDLQGADSNAKVVGVKKHKNYEIVVYEYDESEEDKGKRKDFDSSSEEVDNNDVDGPPVLEHPTTSSSNKPSKSQGTSRPSKGSNPATEKPERDHYEGSASEESSSSSSSSEESHESSQPQPKPLPHGKASHSVSPPASVLHLISNSSKTQTTKKPLLPKPFRRPESRDDDGGSSSGSDEYDSDEFSDEDDSSSMEDDWRRRNRGKGTREPTRSPNKGRPNSKPGKKPLPKKFDDDYSDEYDEDYYSDERIGKGPNSGRRTTSTTRRPLQRPGSRRVTPKPFFPLIYDESDEEYDDDDEDTTTRRNKPSSRKPVNSRPQSPIKLKPKQNSTEDSENETGYDWGIDKSLKCEDPNGKPGVCQEFSRCSIFYQELVDGFDEPIDPADYKCKLPTQVGICCPLVTEDDVLSLSEERDRKSTFKTVNKRKQKRRVINPQIRKLIRHNLNNSFDYGDLFLEELNVFENDLLSRSVQVNRNTPEFGHTRFFPTSKRIRQISNIGLSLLQTSNDISERLQLTNEIGGQGLRNFKSSNNEAINDRCPFQRPCRTSKYRTSDGSCNNLQKPKMGQSLTPLARILEPVYADGRWVPRVSVRGFELPSARLLSQSFIGDRNFPDNRYTLLVMQFGQFLDHDLTSVPVFTFANNSGINCCSNGQFLSPELRHPNCFPIEIPASDPFYSRYGQRCMNFVRSRMAPRIDCSLGYADQMNALTHWIDASNIYGSTSEQTRQLRLFQGGLLRFSELGDGKMLLPLRNTGQGAIDYRAGDDRVNEMQGLMIMHLVWFREHNRIAFELARLNPFWNDEEIFQAARRILIAEYEHIIYNEWLPIVIGRKYMEKAGVVPLTQGYYKGYNPKIDASVANAFSVAAFRMGHTLVQGLVRLIDEMGRDNEVSVISDQETNSRRTRQPNQVDKWLRGMAQQPTQSYDPFITEHLNGRLFQRTNGAFGMDLSSLNVQRSRDHGVPGYNAYRELCQVGRRAKTFEDFKDWIPPDTADRMGLFYAHPDDVDLWIGGISERPLPGALVGPTFACIIGDQFTRSKKGDRYFYDIANQPHSFSPEQLKEVRKVTFARILCDNGDDLEALQPAAFLQADFDFNALVDCKRSTRIPRMNLRLWQKEPTPEV